MTDFVNFCIKLQCNYIENALLKDYTTFRVGGPCSVMVFPDSETKIAELLKYINDNNLKFYIIGRGSNLLFGDDGFDGVIINTAKFDYIEIDNNIISCSSGTSLAKLCKLALENSLTGLEFAYGIPGSVGGAVYMNAGAYGGEIKDVISECRFIDKNGIIRQYSKDDLNLSYRHSVFSNNDDLFILSASFKLSAGTKSDIQDKMNELIGKRKDKQPLEYPSAGSTFKRPEGHFAGALIEESGLKGYYIGGAMVSEKHAGFIINKNGASSADILNLIHYCQEKVYSAKGVKLETEVKIID
jgi:UDP-N-acetylmuramate dehydrogenase